MDQREFEKLAHAMRRRFPELVQFASHFIQDWDLLYDRPEQGAARHLARLPRQRLVALRREVHRFAEEFRERPDEDVTRVWIAMGGASHSGDGVRPMLVELHADLGRLLAGDLATSR